MRVHELLLVAIVLAAAGPVHAEVIDVQKSISVGTDNTGCAAKAIVRGRADVGKNHRLDARVDGSISLLGHDADIATVRAILQSQGTSRAYVELVGLTICEYELAGPNTGTHHIDGPTFQLSVFGPNGVTAHIPLGPVDIQLRAKAGVKGKLDFFYRETTAPLVHLNGGVSAWAYATGSVSLSVFIASVGVQADLDFVRTTLDVDARAQANDITGDAIVKFDPYRLRIHAFLEFCGFWECWDIAEVDLVDVHGNAKTFTLF